VAANREAAWRQAGLHKLPDNATSGQKYTNLSNGGTPPLAPNRALCAVLPNMSRFLFRRNSQYPLFLSFNTSLSINGVARRKKPKNGDSHFWAGGCLGGVNGVNTTKTTGQTM
jgi:hypothetical protein